MVLKVRRTRGEQSRFWGGHVARVLLYAVVTAFATVGIAFLLLSTPEQRLQRDIAFSEVIAHRIASRCFFAQLIEADRTLMEALGIPEASWPVRVDLSAVDCEHVPDIDPDAVESP